jgi:thiol-disulfide isomerase/thioredoxin
MKLASILLFAFTAVIMAAEEPTVRAVLEPAGERKPAPEFLLRDSSGKSLSLKKLRGKVVLLDFWATWCKGCKEELPWFSEFQKNYGRKRFAVVAVSMDDDGWKVVKPFLAHTKVPYLRILLGDEPMGKRYGINALPDAFLIDQQGSIAAAYTTGMVDKDNLEANIQALLAAR